MSSLFCKVHLSIDGRVFCISFFDNNGIFKGLKRTYDKYLSINVQARNEIYKQNTNYNIISNELIGKQCVTSHSNCPLKSKLMVVDLKT